MKLRNILNPSRALRSVLLAAVTVLSGVSLQAQNFFDNSILGVSLGNVSGGSTGSKRWAVFALSGGVTLTDPSMNAFNDYDVRGDVGVAGGGTLIMSNARIGSGLANAYLRNGAVPTLAGGSTISGGPAATNQNALLNPAAADAVNAASAAASLATSNGGGTLTIGGATPAGAQTNGSFLDTASIGFNNVAGSIGGSAGTNYVLNLTNLILAGSGAILTLNGTSTTNYVINVRNYMSLSQGASIQLSGGLLPQNVLFNVRNTAGYDVTMSGASTVDGIILAANRNVKMTGNSVVTGEVIARSVSLSGNSNVLNPLVSP